MPSFLYSDSNVEFLARTESEILGILASASHATIEATQQHAWQIEIRCLKAALSQRPPVGKVYFEYSVPRLGKRIDVVLVIEHVLFVLEFKAGASEFTASAIDQVWDYALDLKNFHETSADIVIAPVLVATEAEVETPAATRPHPDGVLAPICSSAASLHDVLVGILKQTTGGAIDPVRWEQGRYRPTPTIVEAAAALYAGHAVEEISRCDAGDQNLGVTSEAVLTLVEHARTQARKIICFVTGVPGAGKTLVGLDIATRPTNEKEAHAVYLSGNGPLVDVLREALARDQVARSKEQGKPMTKTEARRLGPVNTNEVHRRSVRS